MAFMRPTYEAKSRVSSVLLTAVCGMILMVISVTMPSLPRLTFIALMRWGWDSWEISTSDPFATTTWKLRTWSLRLPCSREEPWVLVATAPPMVWSMNQEKAGSVHPLPLARSLGPL